MRSDICTHNSHHPRQVVKTAFPHVGDVLPGAAHIPACAAPADSAGPPAGRCALSAACPGAGGTCRQAAGARCLADALLVSPHDRQATAQGVATAAGSYRLANALLVSACGKQAAAPSSARDCMRSEQGFSQCQPGDRGPSCTMSLQPGSHMSDEPSQRCGQMVSQTELRILPCRLVPMD